jgi:hypothetical protein
VARRHGDAQRARAAPKVAVLVTASLPLALVGQAGTADLRAREIWMAAKPM